MTAIEGLKFDDKGLVTAVVQDRASGEVRMVAWMNAEALEKTLESGFATFYSRSRQALWVKGETSGHRLRVSSIIADCDGDTLLVLVDPEGPSCHTGRPACFFRPLAGGTLGEADRPGLPYLFELEAVIEKRRGADGTKSYTRTLFDGGATRVNAKLTEEAGELARAIEGETDARVASEAADVLFHLLVGLRLRGVELRDVVAQLIARSHQSGLAEKASRKAAGAGDER